MKRVLCLSIVTLMIPLLGGCVAVSAKGVPRSSRYAAVATADGKIFVVDKQTKTAVPARILTDGEQIE